MKTDCMGDIHPAAVRSPNVTSEVSYHMHA